VVAHVKFVPNLENVDTVQYRNAIPNFIKICSSQMALLYAYWQKDKEKHLCAHALL